MTLVVAQKKGGVIAAVSDTGVMEHGERLPPAKCIPKICILTPDLAVAFAGNPDLAKHYINKLPENADYETTTEHFLSCHREANYQVDFLVLSNRPELKIVRIHDGDISPTLDVAWIGDKAAFETFQRYRNFGPSASVTSVFENPLLLSTYESATQLDNPTPHLIDALRYVISDRSIESVFGFCVTVNNGEGKFKYIDYALLLTERQFAIEFTDRFLREMASERAELREYAISCLVTDGTVDILGVAYHIPHAKLTYVYFGKIGKLLETSRVMIGRNIEEFRQDTAQKFGGEWRGGVASRIPPSPEYGIPSTKITKIDLPRQDRFELDLTKR